MYPILMNIELPNTIQIEGRIRDSWPEYNLATYDLYQNNIKLQAESQAVYHRGKHVRTFTDRYQVLPNERAIEIGEKFATKIFDTQLGNLRPYGIDVAGTKQGDQFNNMGLTQDADKKHVYWNQHGTVCYSLYEFQKPFRPDGNDVFLNVVIGNSINGFCPFSTFSSTFRPYCSNVFMHMMRAKEITGLTGLTLESGQGVGDMRGSKLSVVRRKHTKGLDEKLIELSSEEVIRNALNVIEDYERLVKEQLTQKQAETIAHVLPQKLTTQLDKISFDKEKDIVKLVGEPTQWEAFNDITNKISHSLYARNKSGDTFNPRFESVATYMAKTQTIFLLR